VWSRKATCNVGDGFEKREIWKEASGPTDTFTSGLTMV